MTQKSTTPLTQESVINKPPRNVEQLINQHFEAYRNTRNGSLILSIVHYTVYTNYIA